MALRPFLSSFLDDPWEDMMQPWPAGYTLIAVPRTNSSRSSMQQRQMQPPRQTGVSEVVNTDKEFRVCVDVNHFLPEEIDVKTKDNRVIIHACHEERPDEHGFIMREFTRQYVLPKDVDPATVTTSLNKDGVLTLKAPKMALEDPKERTIPITHEVEEQ